MHIRGSLLSGCFSREKPVTTCTARERRRERSPGQAGGRRHSRSIVGRSGRRGHRRPREWRMATSHFAAPYLPDFAGVIPVKSFRGPVSPGCVSRRMCVSVRDLSFSLSLSLFIAHRSASPSSPSFSLFSGHRRRSFSPLLSPVYFLFPWFLSVVPDFFIAGVHTISRRTLTAPTTSSSVW